MSKPEERTYCSFCGKNDLETDVMVRAPLVVICDECVAICAETIAETRAKRQAPIIEVNTAHNKNLVEE
jgi:ATP-dependent protease Clp ATPase subunit